ncbi:MAG: hypothetical protein LBC95_01960 [Candidatus Nomurabacteria bacterium]|jgi:ABC-type transport system involved in multi-copper enzyme maturation permease subunit|nr:hypothetical protein [Candidatus Nomurabacteria bacterium]
MINYLRAEIYRLSRKKSLFVFLALAALGYLLVAVMRSGSLGAESILGDASFFILLPPVVGGVLFAAIYTDDLGSKNLSTLVGFGLSKVKIVIAKLVLALLLTALIFGLVPLLSYVFYAVLGFPASGETLGAIYLSLLKYYLLSVVFMALGAVVVYGIQRSAASIVTYVVLAFGVVGQLLGLLLGADFVNDFLPNATSYLASNLASQLYTALAGGDGSVLGAGIGLAIYLAAALVVSAVVFNKKEMEF